MFGLFKKRVKLDKIDYNNILINTIFIKTNTKSIYMLKCVLEDIEKQIYNREKRLHIEDMTLSNIKTIEIINWLVSEDGYLIDDINSITLEILKYSKTILIHNTKIIKNINNNYNARRLSPVIIEIKNFLKILKLEINDL